MRAKNHPARHTRSGDPERVSSGPGRVALSVFAWAMFAMMLVGAVVSAPAYASTPTDVVKQVVNQALPVLRDKSTPLPQRRRQLRDLLEGHFDFADMARIALGYHWRELNPTQRAEFTQLFTAFIENAYLSKIQDYSGQEVTVLGENSEGQGFARVHSQIVQQGKPPLKVDYLLREMNGDWKIYDVTVDAISIIANYRNQFNRVINDKGFDKLMAEMRSKQQQLQSSLGS
jgi:phospholipid transport system substrate-binding protein